MQTGGQNFCRHHWSIAPWRTHPIMQWSWTRRLRAAWRRSTSGRRPPPAARGTSRSRSTAATKDLAVNIHALWSKVDSPGRTISKFWSHLVCLGVCMGVSSFQSWTISKFDGIPFRKYSVYVYRPNRTLHCSLAISYLIWHALKSDFTLKVTRTVYSGSQALREQLPGYSDHHN